MFYYICSTVQAARPAVSVAQSIDITPPPPQLERISLLPARPGQARPHSLFYFPLFGFNCNKT